MLMPARWLSILDVRLSGVARNVKRLAMGKVPAV